MTISVLEVRKARIAFGGDFVNLSKLFNLPESLDFLCETETIIISISFGCEA